MAKKVFYVSGMHCPSCEILIEERVKKIKGVKSVGVSLKDKMITIEENDDRIDSRALNDVFKDLEYRFAKEKPAEANNEKKTAMYVLLGAIAVAAIIIYPKVRFSANVNQDSSLVSFFGFGLLAGFSTCAALVGGLLISVSSRWGKIFKNRSAIIPGLYFSVGRLAGFMVGGGILGILGGYISKVPAISSYITIFISILILISALKILGFNIPLPKLKLFRSKFSLTEEKKTSRFEPAIIGIFSFFIPCGFTFATQMFALQSGSMTRGMLIMTFFAFGTLIPLFLISVFGQKINGGGKAISVISKIVAVLIIAFSIWNIYSQAGLLIDKIKAGDNVQSYSGGKDTSSGSDNTTGTEETIRMKVTEYGFSPNKFSVKSGSKVRFEITNEFGGGCTNALISPSLWKGEIDLPLNKTVVKEFVAPAPGRYRFSCWMGMVNGTIEVTN